MRTVIPVLAIAIGLIFAFALYEGSGPERTDLASETGQVSDGQDSDTQIEESAKPPEPESDPPDVQPDPSPAVVAAAEPIEPAPSDDFNPITSFSIRPPKTPGTSTIGSIEPDGVFKMKVDLSSYAGIMNIRLTDYTTKSNSQDHYLIHRPAETDNITILPFGVLSLTLNGQKIEWLDGETQRSFSSFRWDLVKQERNEKLTSAVYQLIIAGPDDRDLLQLVREFRLPAESYDVTILQRFVNLSDQRLEIVWEQFAQGEAAEDEASYLGDRRSQITGYFDPPHDPNRENVYTNEPEPRDKQLAPLDPSRLVSLRRQWPRPDPGGSAELVWFGSLNRYFAVVIHPTSAGATPPLGTSLQTHFAELGMMAIGQRGEARHHDARQIVYTLKSKPLVLNPRQTQTLDLGLFAGPRSKQTFRQEPYRTLQLEKLVIYSLGGPCTPCTFQWLASGLLGFLTFLHNWITFGDWGIAIILLVLCVRILLHPITKKSQLNMMKMGKQMQALAPEIERIKKRYGDDSKKISQETMSLYRERGINPANMLGCLPMLLQMPIWIALYAMLYFAIELRHEAALYGIFQSISGGAWDFLRDLSAPDRFIAFFDEPKYFNLWLITFDYSSINILPILMAVVFFIQQKMTVTPAATEEQRRQQKMMGYITLIFPFIMYSMPSGLTLYIMSSTAIGIYESYLVRKHIRQQEEAGVLFDTKKKKRNGIFSRFQKVMEQKQKEMMEKGGQEHSRSKRRPKNRK